MRQDFVVTNVRQVKFVGKEEYKEKITHFYHNLRNNELIFALEGESIVRFNGVELKCETGVVRFLPKGENREYIVERVKHGECIDIFFDTDVPISETAFVIKLQNSTAVRTLFKKIFSVWVSKSDGYYFECISLLYKIFAEIQKQDYIPEKQYLAIKPAIEDIHENFLRNKISIPELAKKCGISESYLKKLFVKKFGMPPAKHIIQLKINYACDLLQTGLYNITQVAEQCGYSNVYFFSRQFKEYMGITPTAFVEKYKSSKS